MTIVIGIDPGREGGMAVMVSQPGGGRRRASAFPLPLVDSLLHVDQFFRHYVEAVGKGDVTPDLVVVEKQHARPGDGLAGLNFLLPQFGQIIGVMQALKIPLHVIAPQTWKKLILYGTLKDKDAAVEYVQLLYPEVDLLPGKKRKPHDGMADAVCIAEWGSRIAAGETDMPKELRDD